MTEPPPTARAAVAALRTWTRGKQRAPHKPLLLLLALGRLQRGCDRLVAFREVEKPLADLLREFGPTRRSTHPEYPFWRLQHDGLWEVPDGASLRPRASNTDPPVTELRRVTGGFPASLQAQLQSDAKLVSELAGRILADHFPASIHAALLSAVGLDIDAMQVQVRRVRDPRFREAVLRAYGYQCSVCGLNPQLDGLAVGLEAAHVHWHCRKGPDLVENGLCLCPLHHMALDMGLFGLADNCLIHVSSRLHGGDAVEAHVGRYHGHPLRGPFHGSPRVDRMYAEWHRRQVFKGPSRPLPRG
jgi:putative restriction endonuclease